MLSTVGKKVACAKYYLFVKENRYTEDCIMYIHKISERLHKELVMLITSQRIAGKGGRETQIPQHIFF